MQAARGRAASTQACYGKLQGSRTRLESCSSSSLTVSETTPMAPVQQQQQARRCTRRSQGVIMAAAEKSPSAACRLLYTIQPMSLQPCRGWAGSEDTSHRVLKAQPHHCIDAVEGLCVVHRHLQGWSALHSSCSAAACKAALELMQGTAGTHTKTTTMAHSAQTTAVVAL